MGDEEWKVDKGCMPRANFKCARGNNNVLRSCLGKAFGAHESSVYMDCKICKLYIKVVRVGSCEYSKHSIYLPTV